MLDRCESQALAPRPSAPVLDVTVVLLDGGLSSTAVVPVEIFHSAGQLWNDLQGQPVQHAFHVTTVTIDGRPVQSTKGLSITPEMSIDDVACADIIIVPTSGLELDVKLVENSRLLPWLRKHYEAGAYVAGVCAGAAYLAEAGLLDGRMATTHWAIANDFAGRWPQVDWQPDMFVTEDSRLLCSGGLYASMDLSLYLVEKFCGHEIALQCAKALLLPMPRKHQSGYAMLPLSPPHSDARIRAAEAVLQAGRPFARRFKAATGRLPAAYLQAVRIETAKAMLESETAPIQTVSSAVGYDDVAFFRSLFKRSTGMTPVEYRTHFAPMNVTGVGELSGSQSMRTAS